MADSNINPETGAPRGSDVDIMARMRSLREQSEAPPVPAGTPEAPQADTSPQETAEAPEMPPEAASEAPEAAQEAPEAAEPTEAAEAPEAGEEAPEAASEDDDEDVVTLTALGDVAEYLGVDMADLYELEVPIEMPNGRKMMRLGDWKDTLVHNEEAVAATKKAKEEQQAFVDKIQAFDLQIQQGEEQAKAFYQAAYNELMSEYNGIDWVALERDDPGRFAAMKQNFNDRGARLNQAAEQVQQTFEGQRREAQKARQEQLSAVASREQEALLQAIPEWRDEKVRQSETTKLREYLMNTLAYTVDEVDHAIDHRSIIMARKAMKLDEQTAAADVKRKRVVKLNKKPLKPGSRQGKTEMNQDKVRSARAQLKKSGSLQDAVSLLRAKRGRG